MSIVQQSSIVNSQNAHFINPGISSKVGGISGCGGIKTGGILAIGF